VYEDFFARYRPDDRLKFGVFYTPMEITRYQVREVARVLREEFGLSGITDPSRPLPRSRLWHRDVLARLG